MSSSDSVGTVVSLLSRSLASLEHTFFQLPGSSVVARYVRSSHQNDPGRTILELILFLFVVRTLLQRRTRTDQEGKHFIKFSDKVRSDFRVLSHSTDIHYSVFLNCRRLMSWWTSGRPRHCASP